MYILCIYISYLFIYFGNDATVRAVLIRFSIKSEIWTKNFHEITKSETENVTFKIQRVYKIGFPHFTFVFAKEKKQLYFISMFRIKNVLFAFVS